MLLFLPIFLSSFFVPWVILVFLIFILIKRWVGWGGSLFSMLIFAAFGRKVLTGDMMRALLSGGWRTALGGDTALVNLVLQFWSLHVSVSNHIWGWFSLAALTRVWNVELNAPIQSFTIEIQQFPALIVQEPPKHLLSLNETHRNRQIIWSLFGKHWNSIRYFIYMLFYLWDMLLMPSAQASLLHQTFRKLAATVFPEWLQDEDSQIAYEILNLFARIFLIHVRNVCLLDTVNPVNKIREAALGIDSILFGRGSFCVDLVCYDEVSSDLLLHNCLFEILRVFWGIFLLLLPTRTFFSGFYITNANKRF